MDEPLQSRSAESVAAGNDATAEGRSGFSEKDATVLTTTSALPVSELPAGMTPRELAHALQGEMLDHFLLQQFVGGGGMGVVFKSLDTTLDRVVAVKVVASHSISNDDLQRRFLIEAKSAARLDHPNIARVYDSGCSRGLPYIVFEYIEGANIRDLVVNRGPLPLGDALSYTYQIAHALSHAWQRDVVHRDIKPSNILVNQEGQAKLVDMGLARFYQVEAQEDDLTNTGVTLGTFDYISPEQARNPRVADTRSDIYSLGCTLFFMLAGHVPFSEGTPAQKLLQHQKDQPPGLLALRDDLPESVDRLVNRMLAKRPEDRQQTSADLVAEIATITRELGLRLPHGLAPLPLAVPLPTGSRWQHHIPWVIPVVALLLFSAWLNSADKSSSEQQQLPALRITGSTSVVPEADGPRLSAEVAKPASREKAEPLFDYSGLFNSTVTSFPSQDNLQIDVSSILGENPPDPAEPRMPSDGFMPIETGHEVPLSEPFSFGNGTLWEPLKIDVSQEDN